MIHFFVGLALIGVPPPHPEPVILACKFEELPLMLIIIRGGMGAESNTLQIGQDPPVQIFQGSQFMSAEADGYELTFSFNPTPLLTASDESSSETYKGECISTLAQS